MAVLSWNEIIRHVSYNQPHFVDFIFTSSSFHFRGPNIMIKAFPSFAIILFFLEKYNWFILSVYTPSSYRITIFYSEKCKRFLFILVLYFKMIFPGIYSLPRNSNQFVVKQMLDFIINIRCLLKLLTSVNLKINSLFFHRNIFIHYNNLRRDKQLPGTLFPLRIWKKKLQYAQLIVLSYTYTYLGSLM